MGSGNRQRVAQCKELAEQLRGLTAGIPDDAPVAIDAGTRRLTTTAGELRGLAANFERVLGVFDETISEIRQQAEAREAGPIVFDEWTRRIPAPRF